jgi:hypothetical protein
MSGGDKNDPVPFTIKEANAILRIPIVAAMMRRKYNVNSRDWDIPYLAGYSADWSKDAAIYIDRDLKQWAFGGASILTNRFLILHEQVEKALIDSLHEAEGAVLVMLLLALRMRDLTDQIYYHCHGVATAIEEYAVGVQYGQHGVDSYNAFMQTQVKRAEDERLRRVPANLDMTPYQGKDATDRRLREAMRRVMQ